MGILLNTIINLLEVPAARELIDPAAVADQQTGSRFQLTIWVDDADAACAELAQLGVELINGPVDRDGGCALPPSQIPTATFGRSRRSSPRRRVVAGYQGGSSVQRDVRKWNQTSRKSG